jgi:hypothetical protein
MLRANGIYSARKSPKRLFRIRAVGEENQYRVPDFYPDKPFDAENNEKDVPGLQQLFCKTQIEETRKLLKALALP